MLQVLLEDVKALLQCCDVCTQPGNSLRAEIRGRQNAAGVCGDERGRLKVYGLTADPAMARSWYEKARAFGSDTATRRIEMLTTGVR